jgi:hypothetical protein
VSSSSKRQQAITTHRNTSDKTQQLLHTAHPQDDAPLETLEAEYTFMNLEFLKATRMSRVYMVFAATILDVDTLFLVYHVSSIDTLQQLLEKKGGSLTIKPQMLKDALCSRRPLQQMCASICLLEENMQRAHMMHVHDACVLASPTGPHHWHLPR